MDYTLFCYNQYNLLLKAHSKLMGEIDLEDIVFSPQVQSEWSDKTLWARLLNSELIKNPKKV